MENLPNPPSPVKSKSGLELITVNLAHLRICAKIDGIPSLPPDQLALLEEDILRTGRVLVPLIVRAIGAPGSIAYEVIDGRHRFELAKKHGHTTVPAIVDNVSDPLELAFSTALARRQLTVSGKALLLFEKHPEMQCEATRLKNQKANLWRGHGGKPNPHDSDSYERPSFRKLASTYHFDHSYFCTLAKAKEHLPPEDWQEKRLRILSGDLSIPRLRSAIGGAMATKGVTPTEQGKAELVEEACSVLWKRIQKFKKMGATEQQKVKDAFRNLLNELPPDLQGICREI